MALEYCKAYQDAGLARQLVDRISATATRRIRLMEVCGTHTVAFFRSGVRSLLPANICLLSGPGCPVCVTAQGEIDAFIALAREKEVIVATFGDLVRVPWTETSLQQAKAGGADVRIVYSTFDALAMARRNPQKKVVFLGVGFETTAPTIAAAITAARQMQLANFSVFSAHKILPPALCALASADDTRVDGFLLPGHVSVVIGLDAFRDFFDRYRIPSVVAGFEPVDLLQAIAMLAAQIQTGQARLENAYSRVVTAQGNPKARAMMADVFEIRDATWRGLGMIPASGLKIRETYRTFDARY